MRFIGISLILLITVAAAAIGMFSWLGRGGQTGVEIWIRSYLVGVLQEYLNPEVEIAGLDYRYPRTVVIDQLRLRDHDLTLLSVARVELELAEIPKQDQPILIAEIKVTEPRVELRVANGQLLGWSNLVREERRHNPNAAAPGRRISDFLRLRHGRITAAELVYQADGAETEMNLAGLDFDVAAAPDPQEPGAYALQARLERKDILTLSLDAVLDVDAGELRVNRADLQAELDPQRYEIFPPQMQTLFRRYGIAGKLSALLRGCADTMGNFEATCNLDVQAARFQLEESPIQLPRVTANLFAGSQNLHANGLIEAFSGETKFTCDFSPEPLRASGRINLHNIDLESVITAIPQGWTALEALQPAGVVTGEIEGEYEPTGLTAKSVLTVQNAAFDAASERVRMASLAISAAFDRTRLDATLDAAIGAGNANVHIRKDWNTVDALTLEIDARAIPAETVAPYLPTGVFSTWHTFQPRGDLDFSAKISFPGAPQAQPVIHAQLRSPRLSLTIRHAPVTFSFFSGDIDLSPQSLRWNAEARAFEGHFAVSGALPSASFEYLQLEARFQNLRLPQLHALTSAAASPPPAAGNTWDASVSGSLNAALNLVDWSQSVGNAELELINARMSAGDAQLSSPRVALNLKAAAKKCDWSVDSPLLGGQIGARGSLALVAPFATSATWRIDGARLEKAPELARGPRPARYSGRVDAEGLLQFELDRWRETLNVPGTFRVSDGRLVEIPVIQELARLLHGTLPILPQAQRDRAEGRFRISATRADILDAELNAALLVLRGTGHIYFDDRLDLSIRGGPLSKLGDVLGPLGQIVGDVSERAVEYHVGGTLARPQVTIHPLARIAR